MAGAPPAAPGGSYGGLINMQLKHNRVYGLADVALNSVALQHVMSTTDQGLLPMAFPSGSPTHPSYGAGHATVAGACVTVLKAWFKDGPIKNPVDLVSTADYPVDPYNPGTTLPAYTGSDNLTVFGELNKIACNVAMGRSMGGVHFRTDNVRSLRLRRTSGDRLPGSRAARLHRPARDQCRPVLRLHKLRRTGNQDRAGQGVGKRGARRVLRSVARQRVSRGCHSLKNIPGLCSRHAPLRRSRRRGCRRSCVAFRRTSWIRLRVGWDGAGDGFHVLAVEASESVAQTELADRGELDGHRLTLLVVQRDIGFRGIEAADIAGERHDLKRFSSRLATSLLTMTAGLVLRISPPIDGSTATHQTSPRRGVLSGFIRPGVIGYIAGKLFDPLCCLALALLVGRHGAIAFHQIASGDVRAREIVQHPLIRRRPTTLCRPV